MDCNTFMKYISFLLPAISNSPCGGYKVVYEYANYLACRGYDVSIIYPCYHGNRKRLSELIKTIYRFIKYNFIKQFHQQWFPLNPNIKELIVPSLHRLFVPKADVYIATAIQTSYYLKKYSCTNSKRFYLIQDFEAWYGIPDDDVYKTYGFGLCNIAISDWLTEKVRLSGHACHTVKNGFDFDKFRLENPIEHRSPFTVSMLYHVQERKGCKYGIEALERVKKTYPQLNAILFGIPPRPNFLPNWIRYYQQPDPELHNRLLNESAIFLAPSIMEGWGLTVGEAMICGNAIVCSDADGFKEMVSNGREGLIVPIKNADALANGLMTLIENSALRISMANNALQRIKSFTWDNSFKEFEKIILS